MVLYPLYFAKEQINLKILEIRGSEKLKKDCIAQGFCPGIEIMVQKRQGDNMIVRLQSSYFAIGKELSRIIFVQENII